ncbi:hypothetical protein M2138_000614 [Dysgonomonadaceae bacterium PH5-43]|nr:hypothetical protein [Dysgonomonadaceae bacterium PH5-43]
MKKYLSIIVCGLLIASSFNVKATDIWSDDGGSSVIYDGANYSIFSFSWNRTKAKKAHYSGFGLVFSNLNGLDDYDVNLKLGKSYSVLLNFMTFNLPIDHHWLFFSGLGVDWSRYHFKGDVALKDVNGEAQFVLDEYNRSYKSSKLLAYYFTIPVAFEYQIKAKGRRKFFVNGGAEALIKCYSKSQTDIRTPDGLKKYDHKDLNIYPFNFRLFAKVGLGSLSLTGYYQPISMFSEGGGPDVNPWGMGIMLNF